MNDYPGLRQFVAAYLHQDWKLVHESFGSAIVAFVREDHRAALVPEEVRNLIRSEPDESQLRSLLRDDYGLAIAPDRGGGTYRQWLVDLAESISAKLQEADARQDTSTESE